MSVSPIGPRNVQSVWGTTAPQQPPPPPRADMDKALEPVAKALGLRGDELRAKLQAGAKLDDLATQRGLSHDDLVQSITQGLSETAPAGRADAVDFASMAEGIASGARPAIGPGGLPSAPPPGVQGAGAQGLESSLGRVAELLGIGTDELAQELARGSLADVARSRNVDPQSLLAAFGRQVDGYA